MILLKFIGDGGGVRVGVPSELRGFNESRQTELVVLLTCRRERKRISAYQAEGGGAMGTWARKHRRQRTSPGHDDCGDGTSSGGGKSTSTAAKVGPTELVCQ